MCTYTSVLLADTAIPTWHEAHRELPYLFAGSAATSAAGAALLGAPTGRQGPAIRLGLLGAAAELAAERRMMDRLGDLGEPYRTGRPGRLHAWSTRLTVAGAALPVLGRRSRAASALAGAAYLGAGLCTRFGVFGAGLASADDPQYVIRPQRARITG